MSANGAEPPLGLAFSTRVGRGDSRGVSPLGRTARVRCAATPLSGGGIRAGIRGCVGIFIMYNGASRTEFNHVDCTVLASDKMTARKEDNLARGRETEETF